MLNYTTLAKRPRAFLATTGLHPAEFEQLLPAFAAASAHLYPVERTLAGKARQRQAGGGRKGQLGDWASKLLFILSYVKTNPLQTLHGLHFGLSQGQVNYWLQRLLPVLQQALRDLGQAPERCAAGVGGSALAHEGGANLVLDGTERPRQRPQDATAQKASYSGKKKTHTAKNLLLANENSGKVVYLSATVAGKTHDKKAADEAQLVYPANATLSQDTGFQGYAPPGVLTLQPKKSRGGKRCVWPTRCSMGSFRVRGW
jgi:hypothetical protein